jgi:homoserine kinase
MPATSTRRSSNRRSKTGSSRKLDLSLPATSANLGPAFDAAALAMNFYIRIDASPAGAFAISATGRDREICGRLENHLILKTRHSARSEDRQQHSHR